MIRSRSGGRDIPQPATCAIIRLTKPLPRMMRVMICRRAHGKSALEDL